MDVGWLTFVAVPDRAEIPGILETAVTVSALPDERGAAPGVDQDAVAQRPRPFEGQAQCLGQRHHGLAADRPRYMSASLDSNTSGWMVRPRLRLPR